MAREIYATSCSSPEACCCSNTAPSPYDEASTESTVSKLGLKSAKCSFHCSKSLFLCFLPDPCPVLRQQVSERLSGVCEVGQKLAQLIGHAQEPADIPHTGRHCKADNGFDFVWVWVDALVVDDLSQELDSSLGRGTFCCIQCHAHVAQALQYLVQSLIMFLVCLAIHQNVIHQACNP